MAPPEAYTSHGLLRLPRELRDMIYRYYFVRKGGYIYGFETKRLRSANNEPIDLVLACTCRQINQETEGVGLRVNPISFATVFSDVDRTSMRAAKFNYFLKYLYKSKRNLLQLAQHLIKPDVIDRVERRFPTSKGFLRYLAALPMD
ncbi:hypothetical protein P171DRAFT_428802 [Karstenula rhodostoma CBS 690.94]|uniref:Uncharacterized protein n=1 Tax=Karstenula rhodostoma CBS 690.94 TaxID=1392251 RepID=A0A9P4PQY4_9PLEO|nr:hypothetical protein P171DRAFT_428802 [Karstenula rhodostoma CBS 690.94]